jgi:hypothetical protein
MKNRGRSSVRFIVKTRYGTVLNDIVVFKDQIAAQSLTSEDVIEVRLKTGGLLRFRIMNGAFSNKERFTSLIDQDKDTLFPDCNPFNEAKYNETINN